MSRLRLDEEMVRRGLAPSRSRARDAIRRGCVAVGGRTVDRPSAAVAADAVISVDDPALAWVSRGALKLIAALDAFGFAVEQRVCLDIGASTGGFTQVLLARGAACVHAVDVGHGQLDPMVAADPRVIVHEGLNARELGPQVVPPPVDVIVADVSFIPLRLAIAPALDLAGRGAVLVALVKPQFEVGREGLGKGGIVRDPDRAQAAVTDVETWLAGRGWTVAGRLPSPIVGGDGNAEFLVGARHG
ncbi:23S rRNA (cytidine1920-2'-O)/16S rRNA (cytidine1409-2'-O)-methyltransferase [Tepidamorphus gemmatus]|uniref:23S rRNA (Cytidine1920-2'-O)/16S rRNA (Cytidine1409-2'-O)-methyltransferase n=1 Tax=Tepidamorphus gemmatus TaxID=747076 RepID=A0A4R3M2C6_9HYPH|nr:TlyA family RNA methyltransferase [Tepidamorphus gemmatus]TCT07270.1 23S rRNA (cytidine1920-2'-O)/16S rRNA (cytidine1409-2'-O)-methyltransferase [Tepidamorphus gemmatus]